MYTSQQRVLLSGSNEAQQGIGPEGGNSGFPPGGHDAPQQ